MTGRKGKAKLAAVAVALALLGALTAGTTAAYLTDNEQVANVFTVGKVQADLEEPDYPGNGSDEVKDLVPNEEVPKNPKVTNTGTNDMLVFLAVEVPAERVTVVADDGTKGETGVTDLFWLKKEEDAASLHENHFDEAWIALTDKSSVSQEAGMPSRYVFGYSEAVAAGEATTSLFDKVQLKNIIENEITPGQELKVTVNAFAIQASDILSGDTDLTAGSLTEDILEQIYEIYVNQSGLGT